MVSLTSKIYLTFLDHRGQIAKMAICVLAAVVDPGGAVVAAIRAGINAVTDAQNPKASISIATPIIDTPTTAQPYENEDKALMIFKDSNNATHAFRIPAPLSINFVTNLEEIDPTQATVIALVAAIQANAVSQGGAAMVAFVGGRRIRL